MYRDSFRDIKEHRRRRRFLDAMHKKLEHKAQNFRAYNSSTGRFERYDLTDHMTDLLDS